MSNFIKSADLNIQGGLLQGNMSFNPGLNIISGENGTLKTKTLHFLKASAVNFNDPAIPCRRQAISPKRNAQRRAFRQVFEQSRQQNLKLDKVINERNINDAAFEDYPALGDLFYVVYEDLCKDGGNQKNKMEETANEFNKVIQKIFPNYELEAIWNTTTGSPDISIKKNKSISVPLEGLSLGEQEILSLAANIYSSRNTYDVFLIDEPEVHLNWHLEERLFEFFDEYCEEYSRQIIIVTHSRVVFSRRYFPKAQFFFWNDDGRVSFGKDISPEQRKRIAGDAIEVIRLGNFSKPTFFVEDSIHALVIEELASAIEADVSVSECGNKSNVRSLYKSAKRDADWYNSVFLEDGDNEGNPFPGDPIFIHLDKYCMEGYLLDFEISSIVFQKTESEIREIIFNAIIENKNKIFRKNKFFEFLASQLKADHLTIENLAQLDVSEVIPHYLRECGMDLRGYVSTYIQKAKERGKLNQVFPDALIAAIENAPKL